MSLTNPWAKHRQAFWREQAADHNLQLWQRVAFMAYGSHRCNGHANFIKRERELAHLLGDKNPVPANRLSEAIKKAKDKGWLAAESNARCLVVPIHAIEGGLGGEFDRCAVHIGKRTGNH